MKTAKKNEKKKKITI